MNANVAERLLAAEAARSHDILLVTPEGALSRGEIETGARRIAARLIGEGLKPGDRLAVQAEKTPESLCLYLGTLLAGGVYLPLNTAYTPAEVAFFLEDAEPFALIKDPVAFMRESAAAPPLEGSVVRDGEDLAAIVYTSGTTGRSKGAMLSHRALLANALALRSAFGLRRDDVLLHALPIYHVHGLFIALNPALLAGTRMIWRSGFDPEEVTRLLPGASVMMGVPTYYTRLLARPDFTRERTAGVRLFVSGSAPLSPETFKAFKDRVGQDILERYGMSEAGVIAANPLDGARVAGSVGFPIGDYEVRIAGGEVGGIEIRGSSLFSGYWRLPEKTREDFCADGFFRTGDVGSLDAEGRLWISDRAKDLVITGGLNVYPREIELLIDALEGIVESAVVGVPHHDFGEAVVAFACGSGSEAEVIAALRGRIAGFKIPKRVVFLDALPRNAMGKVQKAELRRAHRDLFTPPT